MYLAGVIFGSVGGSLPNPTSYLAGASAGVYALIAAHVSTLVRTIFVKVYTTKWKDLNNLEGKLGSRSTMPLFSSNRL